MDTGVDGHRYSIGAEDGGKTVLYSGDEPGCFHLPEIDGVAVKKDWSMILFNGKEKMCFLYPADGQRINDAPGVQMVEPESAVKVTVLDDTHWAMVTRKWPKEEADGQLESTEEE